MVKKSEFMVLHNFNKTKTPDFWNLSKQRALNDETWDLLASLIRYFVNDYPETRTSSGEGFSKSIQLGLTIRFARDGIIQFQQMAGELRDEINDLQKVKTQLFLEELGGMVWRRVDSVQANARIIKSFAETYLGLIQQTDNIYHASDAGMAFLNGDSEDRQYILRSQLLKYQSNSPLNPHHKVRIQPIRFLLKLLNNLPDKNINSEEFILFVCRVKNENSLNELKNLIQQYRGLSDFEKLALLQKFKITRDGETYIKIKRYVPYVFTDLAYLGFVNKINRGQTIVLNESSYIQSIVDEDYPFIDFEDRRHLWNVYFGTSLSFILVRIYLRLVSQNEIPIENAMVAVRRVMNESKEEESESRSEDQLVQTQVTNLNGLTSTFFVLKEKMIVEIEKNSMKYNFTLDFTNSKTEAIIDIIIPESSEYIPNSVETIINRILELMNRKKVDSGLFDLLSILKEHRGTSLTDSQINSLRGARLEHLLHLLLIIYFQTAKGISIEWSGFLNENGLPRTSPGVFDILFSTSSFKIVIEPTLITGKGQWTAELASIIDHVKNEADSTSDKETIGLFLAPKIDQEVKMYFDNRKDIKIFSMTIKKYLTFFQELHSAEELFCYIKTGDIEQKPIKRRRRRRRSR